MKRFYFFVLVMGFMAGFYQKAFANNDLQDTDDGIRLEAGIGFGGFSDFHTDSQTRAVYAKYLQNGPDKTFRQSSPVPSTYQEFTIEKVAKTIPVLNIKLPSFIELGLPLSVFPSGNYNISSSDNTGSDVTTFNVFAIATGLNIRFVAEEGPLEFFLEGGPVIAPVILSYNETTILSKGTVTASSSSLSIPLGAQGQLGADLNIGGGFLITAYIGYRSLSAGNFESVVTAQTNGFTSSVTSGKFEMVPNGYGNQIYFVPDGQTANYQPMTVDFNAFLSGIQFGIYF